MPTVSAHVATALSRHVEHVFGVMGNGNAFFLDALLRQTPARFVALRHEGGGVAAADAHYRTGGGLAAATCTYGPGFTNTLTALAEARQANIPLVLVTGDAPSAGARPWDIDQGGVADAVDVTTFVVGASNAAAITVAAVQHALARRQPVVLAIPYDLARREAGPVPDTDPVELPAPLEPSDADIDHLVELLDGADKVFLLGGRGAWLSGAGPALGRLADATGAVTASTALARGLFPEHQHDLGVTGGFGAEDAMALVHEADVAVVLGAGLNQFTMRFGELFAPGTRVVQVDTAAAPTNPRVDQFVRGDARLVAEAVAARLAPRTGGWRDGVDTAALRRRDEGAGLAEDGRLDPRSVAARIGELLPDDHVIVSDGGHFIAWANMYWQVTEPDRLAMVGTAFQTIGLGFPSVPGAALARPDSTVVLTTGDGGGLMALADLEAAVRTAGGRGMCVVFNDSAYGAEVNLYGLMGLDEQPMLIPETDFAGMAAALGAEGVVVRSMADLERLADWARTPADQRQFLMLDCRVSTSVIAPYQREVIRVNQYRLSMGNYTALAIC